MGAVTWPRDQLVCFGTAWYVRLVPAEPVWDVRLGEWLICPKLNTVQSDGIAKGSLI